MEIIAFQSVHVVLPLVRPFIQLFLRPHEKPVELEI